MIFSHFPCCSGCGNLSSLLHRSGVRSATAPAVLESQYCAPLTSSNFHTPTGWDEADVDKNAVFCEAMDHDDWLAERERVRASLQVLTLVEQEQCDTPVSRKCSHCFSATELDEIESFRSRFMREHGGLSPETVVRSPSCGSNFGDPDVPWGNPHAGGSTSNGWSSIDLSKPYMVRGATYLTDKKKVESSPPLCDLICVDLIDSAEEIKQAATNDAAGTIRRIRRTGETRRLLVVNFRITPIHLVIVWALRPTPEGEEEVSDPATNSFRRFFGDGLDAMTNAERKASLKVIPRVVDGHWVVRKLMGETPGIIGKNIPIDYFPGEQEFEISIGIAGSGGMAGRIAKVCKGNASGLVIEVNFLIEGKTPEELPERLFGGFRVNHPDIGTMRRI